MRPNCFFQRRKRAFRCAWSGIRSMISSETHARIHIAATILVILFGIIYGIGPAEWCAIFICIGMVLAAEAVNTAVERLADRITREQDPLIGQAKDLAAGAVLILAMASVMVALIIFLPRIF